MDALEYQHEEDDIGEVHDVSLDSDSDTASMYSAESMRSVHTADSMDSMRAMYSADSIRAPSPEHHVITIAETESRASTDLEAATAAPKRAKGSR